ncbi:hypothetical protein [Palleronia abyssalis]|uniref:Uncharacterized protein n=1 Tax=Palleronia abyssalis TaxID=1501240 RepID=A0A2R8C1P7_9RHOB|nr:hypothetical protein [Palleronia abyssalis]SPJ26345.1 hypothetical protein PAA8504_04203 [Palleronia abyssalis]
MQQVLERQIPLFYLADDLLKGLHKSLLFQLGNALKRLDQQVMGAYRRRRFTFSACKAAIIAFK